jgi:hypothetical protein
MLNVLLTNGDPELYTLAKSEYYYIYRFSENLNKISFWQNLNNYIFFKIAIF